jgi:hypothetical protein
MKKMFLIISLLFISNSLNAQWDFNASMGLDFRNGASYRDYVNSTFALTGGKISSFKSAVQFLGEIDYHVSDKFHLGVELCTLLDSQNSPTGSGGIFEISYTHLKPSLLSYYVVAGNGYQFKFGVGAGLRMVTLTETIFTETEYTASGFGILLKAIGNTALSKNLYALIGIDLRYDIPGELSNNGNKIINPYSKENMNLNSISASLNLGLTFSL